MVSHYFFNGNLPYSYIVGSRHAIVGTKIPVSVSMEVVFLCSRDQHVTSRHVELGRSCRTKIL